MFISSYSFIHLHCRVAVSLCMAVTVEIISPLDKSEKHFFQLLPCLAGREHNFVRPIIGDVRIPSSFRGHQFLSHLIVVALRSKTLWLITQIKPYYYGSLVNLNGRNVYFVLVLNCQMQRKNCCMLTVRFLDWMFAYFLLFISVFGLSVV